MYKIVLIAIPFLFVYILYLV